MFGPFGPYGNQFPYVNFHDLNLDWIIKCVRDNNVSVAQFTEQLTEMGVRIDEFQEYIDSLDATIDQKINEELPEAIQHEVETGGFNQVLSLSHKRRVVFIGDSYAQGWTPDGSFTSWASVAASRMGLAEADFRIEAQGGAGFGKSSADGRMYIPTLVNAAYDNIANPTTVTDIVIGLGYNDYQYDADTTGVKAGITNTIAACKTKFPVARIHIFAIGATTNINKMCALNRIYNNVYATADNDYQFYNISESLNHISFFSSDGIHPVQAGHNRIGQNVIRCLNGAKPEYYLSLLAASSVTVSMLVGHEGQNVSGLFAIAPEDGRLFLTGNGVYKFVENTDSDTFTISGNTVTKFAKLTGLGDYTGYFHKDSYHTCFAKMYTLESGSGTFTTHDVAITLGTDSSETDIFLYITILGTSGGTFAKANNVVKWGFQGMHLEVPFITNAK